MKKARIVDTSFPAFSVDEISALLRREDSHVTGTFRDLTLRSHFQPIVSLAHCRTVGFEALLRATGPDGKAVPPPHVFAIARDEADVVSLDRTCRALHVQNFSLSNPELTWLFLNLNLHVIVEGKRYGSFFRGLLERYGFPPHRIVVEILESALHDEPKLDEAVQDHRDLGCLIAIDDFGAGHSNFDRVWRLRPDIVKFDRSIVMRAGTSAHIRSVVSGMVSLVHEAGSLVLMEGIETQIEAMIAMDADADFAQGYDFARPSPTVETIPTSVMTDLFEQFARATEGEGANYRSEIAPYVEEIGHAFELLESGRPLPEVCNGFLNLPMSERCFLLDKKGYQSGANIVSQRIDLKSNPKHLPINDSSSANWSRRHYFRRAIAHPGKVHMTRPYLSAPTASPCITISIAIRIKGDLYVLCGDVAWRPNLSPALNRIFV